MTGSVESESGPIHPAVRLHLSVECNFEYHRVRAAYAIWAELLFDTQPGCLGRIFSPAPSFAGKKRIFIMRLSGISLIPCIVLACVGAVGCQSGGRQSSAAPDATGASAAAGLPSTLPADAVQLTGEQIQAAFSGVREDYAAIDIAGVTASGVWNADGTMSATWTNGSNTGNVAGDWYVDGDMRCIRFSIGSGEGGRNPECTTIYVYNDGYLSVNPDGSLHGYHRNTPL
ncbi:MAG: hypothetical protein R3F55_10715 [Alphaproteobacteria bacterium]